MAQMFICLKFCEMNYKHLILSLVFFIAFNGVAFSQNIGDTPKVERDSRVDRLIEKHRQYNLGNPGVDGF
jgi:hypothetical protein